MERVSQDIDSHQCGSVKGSSTIHTLVELVDLWQQALDEPGKVLCMLLLDYSKAFDRVDHGILLRKLASMGIPDHMTRWVTSFLCGRRQCTFLCGRRQCTQLGDIISEWTNINAGTPQGTLFGPVGFVIHINDLRTDVNISKYVDDSSLWGACDRLAGDSQLQRAAGQALQWSENNHMLVNSDKTKELLVDYSRKLSSVPNINIQGKDIECVDTTKLLGVTITSDLTWGEYVDTVHSKAAHWLCIS